MVVNIKYELGKILDEWIYFATQAKIQWTLAGGSVLGAVRHGGIIPWDDDIDIYISANDISKLRKVCDYSDTLFLLDPFSLHNPNPFFKLTSNRLFGFSEYDNTWEPISVDIFPLVNDNLLYAIAPKLIRKIFNIPRRLMAQSWKGRHYLLQSIIVIAAKLVCMLQKRGKDRALRNIFGAYPDKEVVDASIFNTSVEIEFEGRIVYIPASSSAYLSRLYGDYMALPRIENRIAHYQEIKKLDDIILRICISTKDGLPIKFKFLNTDEGVRYVVVNQGAAIKNATLDKATVINSSDVGLSKSRNTYLASPKYHNNLLVVADNDVQHDAALLIKLVPLLLNYDVVTFNNKDGSGPNMNSRIHTTRSIMKIPSWAIALKNNNMPAFDEQFGLGATYNNGEENIFLLDCLQSGKRVVHYNAALVTHEGISTGFIIDYKYFLTKGAMLRRMFGWKGLLILPIFFLRKIRNTGLQKNKSFRQMLKGFWAVSRDS